MACIAKRRGRYVIDFYDTYGKRRWITMPKGTTKKKAHDKLRGVEDQLKRGIYIPDRRIPTFKEVAEDWIEYKKPNIRASSLKMYKGHLKHHFSGIDLLKVNRRLVEPSSGPQHEPNLRQHSVEELSLVQGGRL